MTHRCPDLCHCCPLMDGAIMPFCIGTAALAIDPHDLSHCTCLITAQERRRNIDQIAETVGYLLRRVRELEKQLNRAAPTL